MKITVSGKKFLHISQENLLTKGQTENIPIEIPRYYNDLDLKDAIFIIKALNSDGIYIECPLSVTEYGVQKIYLTWNTSPILTACEGQIGFQLLAQSADKVVLYQSFVGYAIVNNGILASDSKNFSKDLLEEYLKNFRNIFDAVKAVESKVPKDLVTKGYLQDLLKTKANTTCIEKLAKKEDIFLKKDLEKILENKQNKDQSAKSAKKIEGIEQESCSSYYGRDKNGTIGFHQLLFGETGTGAVDLTNELYYDKQEVNELLKTKPNKSEIYQKSQVDSIFSKKADKSIVYTKTEADAKMGEKAVAKNVYSKTLVDKKLDQKADLVGGIVPTEQLPSLGLGQKQKGYQGSFSYPSSSTNCIIGDKNYNMGQNCVVVGNNCTTNGEFSVAVSGNTYGFLGYDPETQYVTLDEKYNYEDIEEVQVGSPVILVNPKGKSVVTTVLEKNMNHIKVECLPPENCEVVVVPQKNKCGTTANGVNSLACGRGTLAIGSNAFAVSDYATALGDSTRALGINSISLGNWCETQAPSSVSMGYSCTASGGVAVGNMCEAMSKNSLSMGHLCSAQKEGATAIGYNNQAIGNDSYCTGKNNIAMYGQTVVGLNAVPSTAQEQVFNATKEAFIVGGSNNKVAPTNAFRVDFNGQAYANAFHNSGADYAEFFEWEDENWKNEERIGLFVASKANKIKIASQEDVVIGIVSGNAGVVGNNPMEWCGKYVKDDFGRFCYETNPQTKEVTLKISPNWKGAQKYVARANRKEWACVGMFGKIRVRDNGACQVGSFCAVGSKKEAGIAVPAQKINSSKWYVTQRISKNVIEIIFK